MISDFLWHAVYLAVARELWQRAADHFCGEGLRGGVDFIVFIKQYRASLMKKGDGEGAALLTNLVIGEQWPEMRL